MDSPSEILPLAIQLHEQARLNEAEQLYRRILAAEPNNAVVWHNLGLIAKECGQLGRAADCIENAIALYPTFAEALNNLGAVYHQQQRLNEAISCYRRAIEVSPLVPDAFYNLGEALRRLGNVDEAIQCYRRAIDLAPNFAEALTSSEARIALAENRAKRLIAFAPRSRWRRDGRKLIATWVLHSRCKVISNLPSPATNRRSN